MLASRGPRYEGAVVLRAANMEGEVPIVVAPSPSANEPVEALTARESEILGLLTEGLTNKEIAQRLALSSRTVETHVARILAKLGVNTRARAVARAVSLTPGA